jgi:hypothetical protein
MASLDFGINASAQPVTAVGLNNASVAGAQTMAGMSMVILLVLILVLYVDYSLSIWKLAKRRQVENAWMAWVPVLNYLVLFKLAGKPWYWILLMFVPLLNIYIVFATFMALFERFGVSKWLGFLSVLFSPIMLFALPYLAFGTHDESDAMTAAIKATTPVTPVTQPTATATMKPIQPAVVATPVTSTVPANPLDAYVKDARAKGVANADIKQALLSAGWPSADIDKAVGA